MAEENGKANKKKDEPTCFHSLKSCYADSKERGWFSALMYPKVAPAWFRKLVGGTNIGDVHQQPVPKGSPFLLGHISFDVPDLHPEEIYWIKGGVLAGESVKGEKGKELRVNVGPSQLRFNLKSGIEAQRWPGEITIWVDDIRATTDNFNMIGNTLGTDIVRELRHADAGGEFLLRLWDPYKLSYFHITEAPVGFAERIRAIERDVSISDVQKVPATLNPLCISDVKVSVKSREDMNGCVRFYRKYLNCEMQGAGPTQYKVQLHFGPGDGLHQTLTFMQDTKVSYQNMGSICIYLAQHVDFVLSHARAKVDGILCEPDEDFKAKGEFSIKCIFDPEEKKSIVPCVHVIRECGHPECPIKHPPQN